MSKTVVNSSGNVFVDLGYSPDEAAVLQMRADLMADLRKFIKAKRLTQTKAAEILGVSHDVHGNPPVVRRSCPGAERNRNILNRHQYSLQALSF